MITGLLVCADPLSPTTADPDHQDEVDAAEALGLSIGLLDHDALVEGELQRALPRARRLPAGTTALYRGWMLTPAQYATLAERLGAQGVTLLSSPAQYSTAHQLPLALPHLAPHTAPTAWIPAAPGADLLAAGMAALAGFSGGVVLKDYVKSLKHRWHEAGFIPDARDTAHAEAVLRAFLAELGDTLVGGLVLRAALPLAGTPPLEAIEYRRFYLDGSLIAQGARTAGAAQVSAPPPDLFAEVAARFPARFFSMDVAQLRDGGWTIVEVGDGQVSERPPGITARALLAPLAQGSGSGT